MHNRIVTITAMALLGFIVVFSGGSLAEEGVQAAPDVMDTAAPAPREQADSDPHQEASQEQQGPEDIPDAVPQAEEAVEPEGLPPSEE